MKIVLFIHLVCVAAWLGCVLVEAIYEHAIDKSTQMRVFISRLHWSTDKFVEIPAFVGVLLTGGFMLGHTAMTPLLLTKIAFGLAAIAFNTLCVGLAFRRLNFARVGDFTSWEAVDCQQHKFGAAVLVALLVALAIGGYLFAGAGAGQEAAAVWGARSA